jgi:glycosyltransferase involved in cell wall biosynthesis
MGFGKMKFIFFALADTFGYRQIGGTDSYMRRLTSALVEADQAVEWVFYESADTSEADEADIKISNFSTFQLAKDYLLECDDIVLVACYLRPKHKIKLRQLSQAGNITLWQLNFFYPDTLPKKIFKVFEAAYVRAEQILCASERLADFYKSCGLKSVFLPPIIPDTYFKVGYSKIDEQSRLRALKKEGLFLGRLDPRKGILKAIDLMSAEEIQDKVNWTVSGILIETDEGNVAARETLKSMENIHLHLEDRSSYSEDVEKGVLTFFGNADIFVQPYESLSSTVDLPLLILEAQAAGCIVLTTLPEQLGRYLIPPSVALEKSFVEPAKEKILKLSSSNEQGYINTTTLKQLESTYSTRSVMKIFLSGVR